MDKRQITIVFTKEQVDALGVVAQMARTGSGYTPDEVVAKIQEVQVPLLDAVGGIQYLWNAAPPYPPVPPTDPLASFKAKQAISQNCAWVTITPEETGAVAAAAQQDYHLYIQFYTVGGSGGMGVQEIVDAASPTGYSFFKQEVLTPDVNQAADAEVARLCALQNPPRTVPPPITFN
jgi:hypothetical protein